MSFYYLKIAIHYEQGVSDGKITCIKILHFIHTLDKS